MTYSSCMGYNSGLVPGRDLGFSSLNRGRVSVLFSVGLALFGGPVPLGRNFQKSPKTCILRFCVRVNIVLYIVLCVCLSFRVSVLSVG